MFVKFILKKSDRLLDTLKIKKLGWCYERFIDTKVPQHNYLYKFAKKFLQPLLAMKSKLLRSSMNDNKERQTKRVNLLPIAYEADIIKDKDYLLHLPNGETAWLTYSEKNGPTLYIGMWPGEDKTYIEARNQRRHMHQEVMR